MTELWVVRDGAPCAVREDRIWRATPAGLAAYLRGCPDGAWSSERHALHATRGSAESDLGARLAAEAAASEDPSDRADRAALVSGGGEALRWG